MWSLFRESALKELGQPEAKIKMHRGKSAQSFSARWEKRDRDYEEDSGIKEIQADAVRIVRDNEFVFNESILAEVFRQPSRIKGLLGTSHGSCEGPKEKAKR